MKKKICIVGSGHGGGYLAIKLSKLKNFEILLIDKDDINSNFNLKEKIKFNNFYNNSYYVNNIRRAYGIGGGNNLWHGVLTKLEKSDLKTIDKLSGTDLEENRFLYNEVLDDLNLDYLKEFKSSNFNQSEFNNIFIKNKVKIKDYFILNKPAFLRKKIRDLIKNNTIKYIGNSHCLFIEKDKISKNVSSVTVRDKNHVLSKIHADIFVLSCGAIETPRIMLESIEGGYLKNYVNPNIGKYLTDHPFAVIGNIQLKNKKYLSDQNFEKIINDKIRYRAGYLINEKLKDRALNHSIVIKKSLFVEHEEIKETIMNIINNRLYLNFNKIINIMLKLSFYKFIYVFILSKLGLSNKLTYTADVYCHLDQRFKKNSRIRYNSKQKTVDIFFDKTDLEIESIYYVQRELIKIFKHSNYLFSPKNKKNINIHHANHHSGTMKMSKSDKLGVVDKNLKVHGISNLYICDSSIFPYFGNSNPVLTILSLASRLSNFFKKLNY